MMYTKCPWCPPTFPTAHRGKIAMQWHLIDGHRIYQRKLASLYAKYLVAHRYARFSLARPLL